MLRRLLVPSIVALLLATAVSGASQTPLPTQLRLERLASQVRYFATRGIIANYFWERRWPDELMREQQDLLTELRAVSANRTVLQQLLQHADAKVRTLALGALFVRDDPRDLPAIAGLMSDQAPTLTELKISGRSEGGPLPLAEFVAPQTVGDVAQAMIRSYLEAARRVFPGNPFDREPVAVDVFNTYWAERSTRERCASWFLLKMRRASRRMSPTRPEYLPDARRVFTDIDALPPVERAWTLLFVRRDQGQLANLVSDAAVVAALRTVGPDAILKFLRREPPIDDPDLVADAQYSHWMAVFILDHAPELLRASDADAVVASADVHRRIDNNTKFVAAAARLRALASPETAAEQLKRAIPAIPLRRTLGQRDQAALAFALWQIRGAVERVYLTDWFYTALPVVTSPDALEYFLRDVEKEVRPDTSELLRSFVADARFDQMSWSALARILEMVNATLPAPLVPRETISRYFPGSLRADQEVTLAGWRQLLRKHFGITR